MTDHETQLVVKSGVTDGYEWEVRIVHDRHFCGYVRTNFRPPWKYDDFQTYPAKLLGVHGALTYGPNEHGWLGFDCAHSRDVCVFEGEVISDSVRDRTDPNVEVWEPEDVAEECKRLARQVSCLEEFAEKFERNRGGKCND